MRGGKWQFESTELGSGTPIWGFAVKSSERKGKESKKQRNATHVAKEKEF